MTKGVKFWGDKGWIEISREHFLASDESLLPPAVEASEGAYENQDSASGELHQRGEDKK